MVVLIVCVLILTVGLGWTFFKLRQLNGHRQEAEPKHHEYRNQEKNDDKNPFVREPRKRNKIPPKKNNFDPFSTEK
jgi:regulatory protein YycI of two-component signal transduction system YycFG